MGESPARAAARWKARADYLEQELGRIETNAKALAKQHADYTHQLAAARSTEDMWRRRLALQKAKKKASEQVEAVEAMALLEPEGES